VSIVAALLTTRVEGGIELPMLVWSFAGDTLVASTAPAGGGLGRRRWILNAQVGGDYARRDVERHAAELAAGAGLSGDGVALLTAVDVRRAVRREDAGVSVDATVGLTHAGWAAAADSPLARREGTINLVVLLPVRLQEAALLNALCTATEAKSQALIEAGIGGTGTPSDAVAVACPADGPAEVFGGPRSSWGARIARAVHEAVRDGALA
jgi:adenosylcobinamide hydrolase